MATGLAEFGLTVRAIGIVRDSGNKVARWRMSEIDRDLSTVRGNVDDFTGLVVTGRNVVSHIWRDGVVDISLGVEAENRHDLVLIVVFSQANDNVRCTTLAARNMW